METRVLVDETGLIPGANNIYHLGSSTRRWDNVYAATFNGQFVGTADTAVKIRTTTLGIGATTLPVFLTFVNSNNSPGLDEDLYTNGSLSYNIDNETLIAKNLDISENIEVDGTLTAKGNITLGDSIASPFDTVTFNARPNSSIIPAANSTYDLGTNTIRWGTIYADNIDGTASSISGAEIAFAGGDVTSAGQTFDGTTDLSYNLQLGEILPATVSGTTYGSSTTVPTVQVDRKGRITSIGTAAITFPATPTTTLEYSAVRVVSAGGQSYVQNNELIIFNGNNTSFTLPNITTALPLGTKVTFKLFAGFNCRVLRSGSGERINGLLEDLIVDVPIQSSFAIVLVNISSTRQWITV